MFYKALSFDQKLCWDLSGCPDDPDLMVFGTKDARVTGSNTCPAPLSNVELRTAIDAWFEDETNTIKVYGEIWSWDTSKVTDMSFLFFGQSYFG